MPSFYVLSLTPFPGCRCTRLESKLSTKCHIPESTLHACAHCSPVICIIRSNSFHNLHHPLLCSLLLWKSKKKSFPYNRRSIQVHRHQQQRAVPWPIGNMLHTFLRWPTWPQIPLLVLCHTWCRPTLFEKPGFFSNFVVFPSEVAPTDASELGKCADFSRGFFFHPARAAQHGERKDNIFGKENSKRFATRLRTVWR